MKILRRNHHGIRIESNGRTALGLGIAGTAGWLLNGGLGNLFGGLGGNSVVAPAVAGLAAGMASQKCGDDANVSRYDLHQTQTIAQKDMEIAYWRGQDETNRKISDAYTKLENRILGLAGEVRANKERAERHQSSAGRLQRHEHRRCRLHQGQIAQLQSLTKLVVPNSSVWSRLGRREREAGNGCRCRALIHRGGGGDIPSPA